MTYPKELTKFGGSGGRVEELQVIRGEGFRQFMSWLVNGMIRTGSKGTQLNYLLL